MRNFSIVGRYPGIVDVITPIQTGFDTYRFEVAANFDSTPTVVKDVTVSSGWLDPEIIKAGKRCTLSAISNRDVVRFTFNPDTFSSAGISDTADFWMRMTPVTGTPGPMSLVFPFNRRTFAGRYTIAGTAPDVAAASALQLELPAGMNDFVFTVDSGGSNLGVAFDIGGGETPIVAGTTITFREDSQPRLLVRGIGGTSDFSVSFTNAFPQ